MIVYIFFTFQTIRQNFFIETRTSRKNFVHLLQNSLLHITFTFLFLENIDSLQPQIQFLFKFVLKNPRIFGFWFAGFLSSLPFWFYSWFWTDLRGGFFSTRLLPAQQNLRFWSFSGATKSDLKLQGSTEIFETKTVDLITPYFNFLAYQSLLLNMSEISKYQSNNSCQQMWKEMFIGIL